MSLKFNRIQFTPDLMPSDITNSFQQALALHQRGLLAQAQVLYRQILLKQPRHFDSLHLLGLTHVQMSDPEQGVDYIRRALAVKADFPEAHYNLGNALLSLQRPAEALASLDDASLDKLVERIGRQPRKRKTR